MVEDFFWFDTTRVDYKQVREEFNKRTKKRCADYTDKLDAIAEKKLKRLLAETDTLV